MNTRNCAPVPTESAEQQCLFRWAAYQSATWPELRLLYHVPNGGKRGKAEAARFKAEGVKAGVPDVVLPVARGTWHGLYVEMKRQRGGVVSADQKGWLAALEEQGYKAVVCKGWEAAAEAIMAYLKGGEPLRIDENGNCERCGYVCGDCGSCVVYGYVKKCPMKGAKPDGEGEGGGKAGDHAGD